MSFLCSCDKCTQGPEHFELVSRVLLFSFVVTTSIQLFLKFQATLSGGFSCRHVNYSAHLLSGAPYARAFWRMAFAGRWATLFLKLLDIINSLLLRPVGLVHVGCNNSSPTTR